MVKTKARYFMIEIMRDDEAQSTFKNFAIFVAFMKTIAEMHGDYGYAAVKSSLLVKVSDGDICVIRIESSAEKFLATAIPFVTRIDKTPVVLKTIFIGRSIRSCELKLIAYRRKELYGLYGNSKTAADKKVVLDALRSVTAKCS